MQKQIEKMAKIIGENSWEGITRPECYVCAEALYNIGYTQPIKDGDVVLSSREKLELYKEAYEQGKFDANAEIAVGEKVVIDKGFFDDLIAGNVTRYIKETGNIILEKEEYERMKSLYEESQGAYMTSSIGDLPLTVEGLRRAVDEITRLNKVQVELQELNMRYYNEAKQLKRDSKETARELAKTIISVIWEEEKDETIKIKDVHSVIRDIVNSKYGVEVGV